MSELRSPAFVGEQPRAEQHPRRTSLEPVAAVWAFEVVEAEVVLEIPFHGSHPAVVRTAEGAAPQLGQDCALQALDEAVGPRMTRPRTAVLDLEARAGGHEPGLELGPAVGQHGLEPVSGLLQR